MHKTVEGIPKALAELDVEDGSVLIGVDESIYPLDALYGAAFTFIDRFYVWLDRPTPGSFRVTLAPKSGPVDENGARAVAGEFANELLACAWRHRITTDNRAVIEAVTMRALSGALGPPSLDDLAAFDFGQEPMDDPLGIAVSWEEKYKGKKVDAAPAPRTEPKDDEVKP